MIMDRDAGARVCAICALPWSGPPCPNCGSREAAAEAARVRGGSKPATAKGKGKRPGPPAGTRSAAIVTSPHGVGRDLDGDG